MKNLFLLSLIIYSNTIESQIVIRSGVSKEKLVNEIIGFGIHVDNINLNCNSNAAGIFTDGDDITNGILLSTGNANDSPGPNLNVNTSTNYGGSGDVDLDNIANGFTTFDACVLEFDIIPFCNKIDVSFLFASEEYPEYVGKAFNDVFGIFITGPNPNDPAIIYDGLNIAEIAGVPINVNSVNELSNAGYYTENITNNLEYDGLTVPISKLIDVIPCETYHIKIGIADGDDGIFDAAVLIKQNSIDCGMGYNTSFDEVNLHEGCDKTLSFKRPIAGKEDTLSLQIFGNALNGIDVLPIPYEIIFGELDLELDLLLSAKTDGLFEGLEELYIVYENGPCGIFDTVKIIINDELNVSAGLDKTVCDNEITQIGGTLLGIPGVEYYWTPITGLSDVNILNPSLALSNNTNAPVIHKYFLEAIFDGCVYLDTVLITVNPNPKSSFVSTFNCVLDSVSFVSTSTSNSQIIETWNFGDTYIKTGESVKHLYMASGIYDVELITLDANGCSNSVSELIELFPSPKAIFNYNSKCEGEEICFNDLSSISAGIITNWRWNVTNNVTVNQQFPCFQFNTPGYKTVELKVTSDKGCSNSVIKQVEVYDKPLINFTNQNVCINDSISFVNYSSCSSGFLNSYEWSFGDGNIDDKRNTKNVYNNEGNYLVSLKATTNRGCENMLTSPITIYAPPKVNFLVQTDVLCKNSCTEFENLTIDDEPLTSFEWNFGDAQSSSNENPEHCYLTTGNFSVSLKVKNDKGCEDIIEKANYIIVNPNPTANFSVNKSILESFNPKVNINDNSTVNINKHVWNFGDGILDSSLYQGPFSHEYSKTGDCIIKLKVTNEFGCKDDFELPLFIKKTEIIFLPNAFSPDGDNKNDFFFVEGFNTEFLTNFKLSIFDRWGEIIFKTEDYVKKWDGTHKGKKSKQDVYVYKLEYSVPSEGRDETVFGNVTLLR